MSIREQGGRTPDTHRTTNNSDTDRVGAARTSRAAVRRRMENDLPDTIQIELHEVQIGSAT